MSSVNIKMVLGTNLRKARMQHDLTQAALAEKAGTVGNYIALIEKAAKFPSAEMIERLAAALEIESTDLFKPIESYYFSPWGQV